MITIKALNEFGSSSSDEGTQTPGITREAQEEGLYQLYSDALKCLSSGETDSARQMLLKLNDLLNSPAINQRVPFLNQLKYLTLKNLGLICTRDLNYFLEALEIDPTDAMLWLKTGQRASAMQNYQLARNCYEEARHITPKNWIVIDRLLETYFILHDLYSCYKLCIIALKCDISYRKAQIILSEVCRLSPHITKLIPEPYRRFIECDENDIDYVDVLKYLRCVKQKRRQMFEDDRLKQELKRPKMTINLDTQSNATFSSVGSKLLNLMQKIKRIPLMPSIPIDVCFDDAMPNQNDSCGGESGGGSANTSADEVSNIGVESKDKDKDTKEKDKKYSLSRSNSNNNTTGTFPLEYLDKRRSSRVKNILNKSRDIDERNVYESIIELIPESIKDALKDDSSKSSGDELKDNSDAESGNIKQQLVPETEVIKRVIERIKLLKTRLKTIRTYDLIEEYLCELSSTKSAMIPPVFNDLYAIYRANHQLPCAPFCVIGRDISLEHIWMTLVANELKYSKTDGIFLTQMMVPLEGVLSSDKYHEYCVRIATLRGIKEANNEFLDHALELLNDDSSIETANNLIISKSMIKSILESQSQEVMSKMIDEQNHMALIKLLMSKPESELTIEEEKILNDSIVNSELWQKGIDIFSSRSELNTASLNTIIRCLETGTRGRLTYELTIKLVKLAAVGYSVLPWNCLYWGLYAEKVSKSSITKFLKLGHQYLGRRGICTTNNGEFLHLALQHFIEIENDDNEVIKCFTCLYNFPQRKVPNPQTQILSSVHISSHITLIWENCEIFYNYFIPEDLPEFDSIFRLTGIGSDIEPLLLRIVELIPDHLKPNAKKEAILNHLNNGVALPEDSTIETTPVTETIYYLLADYYFKNMEFRKACDFYLSDIAINPNRFDSWAGSALSRSSQLEQQLIAGDNIESRFYRHAASTLRCFERALKLDPQNTKLWIEYGNLAYNIASLSSRLRKTALFMQSPMGDHLDQLQTQHDDMLRIAKYCFDSANNTEATEEIWLPYYMLGKVMEKRSAIFTAIKYYEWAQMCLYADGSPFPKKIQYHNPPPLAVEALECHYRIHAATLKLLTSERKCSTRYLRKLKLHLIRALRSPFAKQLTQSSVTSAAPVDHDYATGTVNTTNTNGKINDAVKELMNDMMDFITEREQRIDATTLKDQLITLCLNGMKRCLNRYPAHYKSVFRLAHYYHTINDNHSAKSFLLGGASAFANPKCSIVVNEIDSHGTDAGSNSHENVKINIIPGLFAEKKANNLFNGIWRIPIDDIDRPGSFNSHMFRSTFLLIRVCTLTHDYQSLCTNAQQLSRTPDIGKKYLRDADRRLLARFSFESCALLLKSHLQNPMYIGREKIITDIQRIVERFIKANVFVNEANALLIDLYQFSRRT